MALSLDDLTAKVDNGGVTPDGLLTAKEYNALLAAVKENAENSTDEHIGSVVVDNTLSEVKADSNKPVNSVAVASATRNVPHNTYVVTTLSPHIITSSNLADLNNIEDGIYISDNGSIGQDAKYKVSTFIPVIGGEVYSCKGIVALALYDAAKSFITRVYGDILSNNKLPIDVAYVRISSNTPPSTWQLNLGDTLLPYEPHYTPGIDPKGVKDLVEFVKSSPVFKDLEADYEIGGISANGSFNNTLKYCVRTGITPIKMMHSGSVEVQDGYEICAAWYSNTETLVYNKVDTFVKYSGFGVDEITWDKDDNIIFQIRKVGDTTPLTDTSIASNFIWKVFDSSIDEKLRLVSTEKNSEYYKSRLITKPSVLSDWWECALSDRDIESIDLPYTAKYAKIVGLFDELMSIAPEYITKHELGKASGVDDEGKPYTLYEYRFMPMSVNPAPNTSRVVPKVLITSSIHGFEKTCTFGLYFWLKELVNNWQSNEFLRELRHKVEIRVIPVLNPWGFDNNDYNNANNVNINRNFPCNGWQANMDSSSSASGEAPLDQPESGIAAKWLSNNKDALLYIDCHTNGYWWTATYFDMCAMLTSSNRRDPYFNRLFDVMVAHITNLTSMWPVKYPNITPPSSDRQIGRIMASKSNSDDSDAEHRGIITFYANTYMPEGKIISLTFEGFNAFRETSSSADIVGPFGTQAKRMNAENIANFIREALREYSIDI